MTTIPNELKINVRTSVPGHQVFRLEPSMIIKDASKDAYIYFNPLIKLNKSVVDKVPEYLRKKQFVSKGLFDSLIRFKNSAPAKSLLDAKKNGYIDNNIEVTLNTIMPGESVITIGGRQYVIVDLQWTKGSWKLDTKRKPVQYDINKITDPFIFNAIISDEIVKGENELTALPKSAVYGENYTGPKNVVAGLSPSIVPTTGVTLGGPPGSPHGSPPGGPYPVIPAPVSAADIAAAVAAAVAALPPPPAAPARPPPPTSDEIADAIIAAFRTLASGGFGYMRPGAPYDIRLIMADAARAVHAALPPPPPPPALPAVPTALQIADAIRDVILALPPPQAPVVNVAPPVVNIPALPAPPVYPTLMPPPAKEIERTLKRFLPHGIKSATRKNISSGIVSSMVSAYSESVPRHTISRIASSSSGSDSDSESESDIDIRQARVRPSKPTKMSYPLFEPDPEDIIPENFTRLKAPNNAFVKSVFLNRGTLRDANVAVAYRHNSTNFYTMLNYIYTSCDAENRGLLRRFLRNSTTINVSEFDVKTHGRNKGQVRNTLSEAAYTESVQGLDIIFNRGGGDCLFIAAVQAINHHNLYNQDNKQSNRITTPDGFGTRNKSFTQEKLREITARFFQTWSQIDDRLAIAQTTTENLNEEFERKVAEERAAIQTQISLGNSSVTEITNVSYRKIIEDVYRKNENFLTESIYLLDPSIPIPGSTDADYNSPFRAIRNKKNIKAYVESPFYWAGPEAIIAISNVLKLQIIPIQIGINATTRNVEIKNVHTNFDEADNQWNKYLFLYYDPIETHYELMAFSDYSSGVKKRITIFDRAENAIVPPLYILFTIYGIFYSSIGEQAKQNFTFRRAFMDIINAAIQNLRNAEPNDYAYSLFYISFKNIFPTTRMLSSIGGENYQLGGYYRSKPYPNRYPSYPNRYPQYTKNAVKVSDSSQLAYYITIDLQLQPGTSITPEEKKNLNCNHKWNSVRKSYSQLVGKQYDPKPDYSLLAPPKNNNTNSQKMYNKTQQNPNVRRPTNKYATRKYRKNPLNYGGKKRKTIKRRKTKKIIKTRKNN